MSARMAAATGEPEWEQRYRALELRLDTPIKEALALEGKHDHDDARHATKTDTANAALVEMENLVFGFVKAGRLEEARAVLSSNEYEEQKEIFARGMSDLDTYLERARAVASRSEANRAFTRIAAVLVVMMATVAGSLVFSQTLTKWQASLSRMSIAVEQSPATVVITDTGGTIEYVNPRFTEVTGYTKEEAVGRNPRILKSGKWPRKAYEGLWKTILAGQTWRGEFHNKKKNGDLYWESASISPMRDTQGEITHFLAIKEDITERKQKEEELRQAKVAAEVANEAKSDFLANMSHEIRTPMTAILGFAENLLDTDLSESEKLDFIHTIRRNGESLLGIINDILDISKIEAGKMGVTPVSCEPCTILAEVVSLTRIQAEAKGLPLTIEYEGAVPQTINTDPTRLRQILINLVGNALKFTENGAVHLVTRFVDDSDSPCMQFDVIDTGRGMTKEQEAKLFQPFTQADTSTTRESGGTGLGLTISKRFAELLGGDITVVETEVGVGSTFRATVATGSLDGVKMLEDPLSATVVAEDSNAVEQASRSDLRGFRILLAEDGPDNQRLISFCLKKAGADVTVEENGKLALDAAMAARDEGKAFDVILMDMQMPVMDGYESTGQLRKQGYSGPIIALTAHAMEGDREKCINAGCDDYAAKPIDRQKLIDLILQYVQDGQSKATTVQAATPELPPLRNCRILLAEDNPTNQVLVVGILKKAGAEITAVKDGKLALDAALAACDNGSPFDIILMDIQMPVMSGDEATRILREKGYAGTIIAVTAHAMRGDRKKYLEIGFDDCAAKPINRVKLIETMHTHFAKPDTDVPSDDNTPDVLRRDLADDDMHELVESFVANLAERVAAIEKALADQDFATLGTLAHQLKGSAGGYGFPSIADAARLLESSAESSQELDTLTEQAGALAGLCGRASAGAVQRPRLHDVARVSASHESAPAVAANGTVLVVDDDSDTRHLFHKILERDGFQVHEACDGIDALVKVPDIRPHVILMDVEMPNMDGLECIRKLRADPALSDIPVIIVSGKTDSRHVRAGLEAGAQEYITKPIQQEEFLLRVRAMSKHCRGEASLLESNAVRGEQARAMGILFDLSRSLAAAESLGAVTRHAVTSTSELMNSRRVSVMLPDDTGQNLFVASAIGIDRQLAAKIQVQVGSAIAGKVFASGKPTVFNSQGEAIPCTERYESEFFASVPLASTALSVPNKVVGVLNVTERHDQRTFEAHEIEYLDLVCNMTALAIEQFQSGEAREHAHAAIVIGLAKLAEHCDSDTGKHLERVTQFALLLASELRKSPRHASTIDDRFLLYLKQAMPLHDIGKVSVPDAILLKPGKLTEAKFSTIKRHTEVGASAIQSVIERAPEADFLLMARDIAHFHHEWFDGSGYPCGLSGEEIPLAARIAAIADVYDALTTKRPYKEPFPHEKAMGIIRDSSGSQFDPDVVDTIVRVEGDLINLASRLADGVENRTRSQRATIDSCIAHRGCEPPFDGNGEHASGCYRIQSLEFGHFDHRGG